jgi:hypothetical protein
MAAFLMVRYSCLRGAVVKAFGSRQRNFDIVEWRVFGPLEEALRAVGLREKASALLMRPQNGPGRIRTSDRRIMSPLL